MSTRFASAIMPLASLLAAAAISTPAQAGVGWSIGIDAPIAPGMHVGTVIGGGGHHRPHYRPAPVVYAPPVYVAPPVYAPAPVVYAPRPVYYQPRPVAYRAPVIVRPGHGRHHQHHGKPPRPYQPQGGQPGRGGGAYGPMARADAR